jgi:PAS domain S-box-containing protein
MSEQPRRHLPVAEDSNIRLRKEIEGRQRMEQTLRESEERFRKIFENAAMGIAITDWEGRFQRCNPAYAALLGYSEEELHHINFASLLHPEDQEANLVETRRLRAGEIPSFEIENRYIHRDGRPVWVRKFVSILPDETGKPAHLLALVTDITERKRIEEQRQQFVSLAENSHEFISMCDMQFKPLFVNGAALRMVGLDSLEQAMRTSVREFFFPDDQPFIMEKFFPQVLREGHGEVEIRFRHFKTGEPLWMLYSVFVLTDPSGRPSGFATVSRNITERKQAEAALHESEQRLRLMADALPVLIAYVGVDCRYQFNNASYEQWFGLPPDACKGRHMREVVGEAIYSLARPHVEAALAGQPRTFEAEVPFRTGGTRGVLANYVPHRNAAGKVVGCYALILDLTERRNAEEAVRDREARLRAILDTASDAIITIDQQGTIQAVNPAVQKLFGYTPAEMIGQNVKMLMSSPYRQEHDRYLARYLQTRQKHMIGVGREVEARCKDGRVFPVDLAVSEIPQLKLFTGILRDITRRKELEREVVEIASLEQRRIGEDLHDSVGQELTALNLLASELGEILRTNPTEGARLVERIVQGLRRSRQELRAVLQGLLPVAVETEGLMAALADLADRIQQEGKAACRFDCPEPVRVADNLVATHLFLIAKEAVHNALRHARPRKIRITLKGNHLLVLRVQDDGIGMAALPTENAGLGLRVMHNRAAIIGANLAIEPAEPSGTLITCALTRKNPERHRGPEASPGPEGQ